MRSKLAVLACLFVVALASCEADVPHPIAIEPSGIAIEPSVSFAEDVEPEASALVSVGDPEDAVLLDEHEPIVDIPAVEVPAQPAGVVRGTVVNAAGSPIAGAVIALRSTDMQRLSALGDRWVHPIAGTRLLPTREYLKFGAARSGTRPIECGRGHCGIDIGWERGTIVHAVGDGTLTRTVAEDRGEAGRAIVIDHPNGLRSYYLHLDELRPGLAVGQPVHAGEPIGTVGETGAASGPHLHFALSERRGDRDWFLDPEPILAQAVVLAAARSLDPLVRDALVISTSRASTEQTFTTDARGGFRIAGVLPGKYVAVAMTAELAPSTSSGFTVRDGAETDGVAITLRPGTVVEGQVLGRNGPIAGARITAIAGTGESAHEVVSIFATGPYSLRAMTGTITIAVSAPGHTTIERQVTLQGLRRREDFTLAAEDAVLRGQVHAGDGGLPGNITLRVVDGPTRRRAVADATGRFEMSRIARGSYLLEVSSDTHPTTRVRVDSDRFADIRLATGGSLATHVRDGHSGVPLAGIHVEATGPDGHTASAFTDSRGVAQLRALAVGNWTLHVRAKTYAPTSKVVVVRATRVAEDARIDLARGALLEGVVRDRHGRRVAGARVSIDGRTTTSDPEGNFRLADVAPGTHQIEAELDTARGAVGVQLKPGDELRSLTIELR